MYVGVAFSRSFTVTEGLVVVSVQIFLGSIMRSTRNRGCTKYDPSRRRLLRLNLKASSLPATPELLALSPVIITFVTVEEVDLSEVVILKFNWICLHRSSY
jgi:hypothetical protein